MKRTRHLAFPATGAGRSPALWIAAALLLGVGVNCLAAFQVAAGLSFFN